jgi:hypothetical protein
MFDIKRTHPVIPGYTGFIPATSGEEVFSQGSKPTGQIPGYSGFIPAVKAENLFAKTYGKLTHISDAGEHEKGSEIPDHYRYTSMLQDTFVNQRQVTARTVAEIVGVVPKKTVYTESGPIKVDAHLYNNTLGFGKTAESANPAIETVEEKGPLCIGNPVPGYTGVSRRVVADNIFGCTYAESRRKGDESHTNINHEKVKNFSNQSNMIPPLRK